MTDLIRLRPEPGVLRFVDRHEDIARGKPVYLFYNTRLREIYGCSRAVTPIAPEGLYVLWVWDPFSRRLMRQMTPDRQHRHLQSIYASEAYDLVYLVTAASPDASSQTLHAFDMKIRKEFLDPVAMPFERVLLHGLAAHSDGYAYGLTPEGVFRIDAFSNKIGALWPSPARIERGIAVTPTGVYFQADGTLWRFRGPDWPAPDGALPAWTRMIRSDHPRLFLDAELLPTVRSRALGRDKALFEQIRQRVEDSQQKIAGFKEGQSANLGHEAAEAAFCYLVTQDDQYLDLARKLLHLSVDYYEKRVSERQGAGWWAKARTHFIMAWDWLYNDLPPQERTELMDRFARTLQAIYTAEPAISRENMAGIRTGFYGVDSLKWFVGCTTLGTPNESEHTRQWLVRGYNDHLQMLRHRSVCASDDGGSASSALGYGICAYPWAEQNFYYTSSSSTGQNIAPNWPFSSLLAYYIYWNRIASPDSIYYLRHNAGDTNHQGNKLESPYTTAMVNTHLYNIRHLYPGTSAAALSGRMLAENPEFDAKNWFIHAFLWNQPIASPSAPLVTEKPLLARYFDGMGQVFMRSGTGPDDTYCLLIAGGVMTSHRNLDALSFTIYRKGMLAVDSGDYHANNNDHRANYFEQTVAHNTILVHQPDEPRIYHWAGEVVGHDGGQHRIVGSRIEAFETTPAFAYVAADATRCYDHGSPNLPPKVSQVTRQFVFLPPGHFVIFDRVVSTDPSYRKQWLLHTAQEPVIDGDTFRADQGQGRLFCRTLLPRDGVIQAIGGPGKEFWALGRNWPWDRPGENKYAELTESQRQIMGQWRVEVSPGSLRREDFFLHVIQVDDQSQQAMDDIVALETQDTCGVRIVRADGQVWELTFHKSGPLAGHIRAQGDINLDRPLTQT
ncbi:MAG TPA: heparinase II/III family protein, partial [Phycisphaeraceae bacterium]